MEDKKSKIIHKKSFMPKDVAEKVYHYAKSVDSDFTEFGNAEKEFTVFTGKSSTSASEIFSLLNDYGQKVYSLVKESYDGPFQDYDPGRTHIARFEPGSKMHEHFDSSRPNDIATLLYINDDYLGGEIYFPELDISIKPEAGDLVCFPDNPDFIHGVKEITGFVRYTAPRWFTRIV
jgi:hypothetical protein